MKSVVSIFLSRVMGRFARVWSGGFRRAGWFVGAVAALALCRWWLLANQAFVQSLAPGCLFRRWSGWYCPGCGATRAVFALLHGDVLAAWRMNPLLIAGLAAGGWLALVHGTRRLRNGRNRQSNKFLASPSAVWWFAGAVLAFWILRNLPWWPCTWLAPAPGNDC